MIDFLRTRGALQGHVLRRKKQGAKDSADCMPVQAKGWTVCVITLLIIIN